MLDALLSGFFDETKNGVSGREVGEELELLNENGMLRKKKVGES